jgi:DNA-binding NarL/FixJ family response regulator
VTDDRTPPLATGAHPERSRILIVDDHLIVRQGLRELIQQEKDLVVCGDVGDADAALAAVEALHPDLALIDISLGKSDGLSMMADLQARSPETRLLVLSMHSESLYALRCLRAGARGYIMKEVGWGTILAAIRTVLAGELYVSEKIRLDLLHDAAEGRAPERDIDVLSDRELTVFRLIGDGHATHEIAEALGVSPKTVETYRERIKGKLGLASGSELVQRAVAWGGRGGRDEMGD